MAADLFEDPSGMSFQEPRSILMLCSEPGGDVVSLQA